MRVSRVPCVLAACLALVSWVAAQRVRSARFDNGLELHLEEVVGAKDVGLFCFVKSGFADDPVGRTGLAHFVEHLVMCAATPERKPGWPYLRWVRERKVANAMTRARYTVYFSVGSRDEISSDGRRFADVLAGRAEITQALVDRERSRMLVEIANMTEIRPGSALQWRARAFAIGDAPEARIGIGLRPELASLDLAALRAAYLRSHRPAKARLVVVGRVDPDKDFAFWRELFGGIVAAEMPKPIEAREATPALQRVAPHGRAGAPFGVYGFAAPPFDHADFAPFLLAATWMRKRAAAALRPRGRELAAGLWPALYAPLDEPRVCYFGRRGRDGDNGVDKVRAELDRFLEKSVSVASDRLLESSRALLVREVLPLLMPRVDLEQLRDGSDGAEKGRSRDEQRAHAQRTRMLISVARYGSTAQGLYRIGLARGSFSILGVPDDIAERVMKASGADVARVLRERFAVERGSFVGAIPLIRRGDAGGAPEAASKGKGSKGGGRR